MKISSTLALFREAYAIMMMIGLAIAPLVFLAGNCDSSRECTAAERATCVDFRFCNGEERCEVDGGTVLCIPGFSPCTREQVCDESRRTCLDACTSDSDCPDVSSCSVGRCEDGGCTTVVDCARSAAGCSCSDGDRCTVDDVCAGGECGGTPKECPLGGSCDPATGACPPEQTTIACCLPSGRCEDLEIDACQERVGSPGAERSTCASSTCSIGACCLPSGACSEITEDACGKDEGVYQGDEAACEAFDCSRGACCIAGVCSQASASECAASGGDHAGIGVPCNLDTCGGESVACCLEDRCEVLETASACTEQDGEVIPTETGCPQLFPADDFEACQSQLVGSWGMRRFDPETGSFSGSSDTYYFLPDGNLIDGHPEVVQSDDGPVTFFYALYERYLGADGSVTAEGCAQPSNFPPNQFWTERTISDGAFERDPCTGECILTFTETLVTTEPDGDVRTAVFVRRSVGRSDLPEGLCYLDCIDLCNAGFLPQRCWRNPPGPPYRVEFGDFDEWLAAALASRTCAPD